MRAVPLNGPRKCDTLMQRDVPERRAAVWKLGKHEAAGRWSAINEQVSFVIVAAEKVVKNVRVVVVLLARLLGTVEDHNIAVGAARGILVGDGKVSGRRIDGAV